MPSAATWLNLGIVLHEISHTEKEKYHTTLLRCGI